METAIAVKELSDGQLEHVAGGNLTEGAVAAGASGLFIALGGGPLVPAIAVWAYIAHKKGLI